MLVQFFNKRYMKLKKLIHEKTGEKKYVKHVQIETAELFLSQHKNETFNRYDVIVRYLAVENYYNKNSYGFALYRKMQELRNPNDNLDEYEEKFRKLIASFECNGYSCESEVVVDEDLQIEDGAHRLSLALYWGVEKLNVQVLTKKGGAIYSLDWFRLNGFTDEECGYLIEKEKELREQNNQEISIVLWPKVRRYFDEITNNIGKIWDVSEYKDIFLKEETFGRAVKAIYHVDDISISRIEDKIKHLGGDEELVIRIVKAKLLAPRFRAKQDNGHTLLIQGEQLKSIIRTAYKAKIKDYYFDNIVHTADNFFQSKHIIDMFFNNIDLRDYFAKVNMLNWMLIKLDTDYLPEDFPKEFAFSKDIDMICEDKDFDSLIEITQKYFVDKCSENYEIRKIHENKKSRLRIEKNGFLLLQIDISKSVKGIKQVFIEEALYRKVKCENYFVTQIEDEVCFRINEYINHPDKKWHLEYIHNNEKRLDKERIMYSIGIMEEEYTELMKCLKKDGR